MFNPARAVKRSDEEDSQRFPILGHVPVSALKPAPENDKLYRPVDPADPEIIALAASIREHGLQEPIVISEDSYILSGHRRHCACKMAGLERVRVRIEQICRDDDPDRLLVLLREFNRQRDKSLEEKLREEVVTADPHEAYQSLIRHRKEQSQHVNELRCPSEIMPSYGRFWKEQDGGDVLRNCVTDTEHLPVASRQRFAENLANSVVAYFFSVAEYSEH